MSGSSRLSVALAPLILMLGASQAAAAPQILAIIASAEPVTLQCERGECGAEFTVYCIEQRRSSPEWGTAYYIHDPSTLTLEGLRRDGTTVGLAAAELLTITTERGHTAVRMSFSQSVLERFDLASVRVSIGERASLIPEPVPNDTRPHTEIDIVLATGPLRSAAAAVVDDGAERVDAARLTARMINALPRRGRADQDQREQLWLRFAPPAGAPGRALAQAGFEHCSATTFGGMTSLRQCLGSQHDTFIGKLNTKYWRAIEVGS